LPLGARTLLLLDDSLESLELRSRILLFEAGFFPCRIGRWRRVQLSRQGGQLGRSEGLL
jgi:hypothetical protein